MSSPSEVTSHIQKCIQYRLDGPYIVVDNDCHESFLIDALEIHYYVTVKVEESTVEHTSAKKEISERLSIGKRIQPGGSIDVYFGPVENIVAVYVVVDYAGGKYKVEIRRKREEKEAYESGHG